MNIGTYIFFFAIAIMVVGAIGSACEIKKTTFFWDFLITLGASIIVIGTFAGAIILK